MVKSLNGDHIKKSLDSKGFSLIEILVTILIGGILFGVLSTSFPSLNRTANTFLEQTVFQEQYLIFLLKFEEEFQQAENVSQSDLDNMDQLIFNQDLNLDGDYLDSGERISYRWNSSEERIDRKSGNGNFQAFLDGITDFSWSRIGDDPFCYQQKIKDIFNVKEKVIVFCRKD